MWLLFCLFCCAVGLIMEAADGNVDVDVVLGGTTANVMSSRGTNGLQFSRELQSAPPLFLARYEDLCQNFNSIAELAAPSVANYNALKKIYLYCKSSLSGNISLDTVYNHLIKDDKADLYIANTRISKQILNPGKLGYVLFLEILMRDPYVQVTGFVP